MSKVSMTIDVDPWVIEKFIDVIESHNVSLRKEAAMKYFKYFFDEVKLLFDQEERVIQVRMK